MAVPLCTNRQRIRAENVFVYIFVIREDDQSETIQASQAVCLSPEISLIKQGLFNNFAPEPVHLHRLDFIWQ